MAERSDNMSMWNSKAIAEQLALWFYALGISSTTEMNVGHKKSIDFGTDDGEYGIELKSSKQDLMSGYGLNQEMFKYGFVLCPQNLLKYTVGHIIVEGYNRTGVLYFENDDWTNKNALKCALEAKVNTHYCFQMYEAYRPQGYVQLMYALKAGRYNEE